MSTNIDNTVLCDPKPLSPKPHTSQALKAESMWVVVKIMALGIIGIQKGTIILTTTHVQDGPLSPRSPIFVWGLLFWTQLGGLRVEAESFWAWGLKG